MAANSVYPANSATLGWKLIYQIHLRGGKSDYALSLEDDSWDGSFRGLFFGRLG